MSTDNENKKTPAAYKAQTQAVNELYDAAEASEAQKLKTTYENELAALTSSLAGTEEDYRAKRNAVSAQTERDRADYNTYAAASGINTGAGSQARLAMDIEGGNRIAQLYAQESGEKAQGEAQKQALYSEYLANLEQAAADNEYKRAQALLDEYTAEAKSGVDAENKQLEYDRQDAGENYDKLAAYAKQLSQYGDFSGYSALGYTDEQIAAMTKAWQYTNPELYAAIYGSGAQSSTAQQSNKTRESGKTEDSGDGNGSGGWLSTLGDSIRQAKSMNEIRKASGRV